MEVTEVMPDLTPDQIRQSRDALQDTVDQLNRLLMAKRRELSQDDIDKINEAVGSLLDAADKLTAQAIKGTAEQIASSVQGIQDATNNANHALKVLDNIRKGINIAAALVGLGTAILAGNPGGIITAATEVIGAARAVIT